MPNKNYVALGKIACPTKQAKDFGRTALGGGGVGAVAGAALQFPSQALNGGVKFAGSDGLGVRGPVAGGHEPGNLLGALLHGGQVLCGAAELSDGEWVPILHPN